MEIRQLYFVLSVAKNRSFTKAAEDMHTTQPNISKQIGLLEEELGAKLFSRNHQNVLLTRDGERFCLHAQRVVDEFEDLLQDFEKDNIDPAERLDLGVFPFFENVGMADLLRDFFINKDHLLGTVRVMENYDAYKALDSGDITFAILKLRPEARIAHFKYRLLIQERLMVIMNRNHSLASRESISLDELKDMGIDPSSGSDFMGMYTGNSIHKMYSSPEFLMKMISEMGGLTFITESSAATLDNPDVTFVKLDPPVDYCTYLVYPKDRKNSGIEREFIDFLCRGRF